MASRAKQHPPGSSPGLFLAWLQNRFPAMSVRPLLSLLALLSLVAGWAGSAGACEKHLQGHQNSSATQGEVSDR